VESLK